MLDYAGILLFLQGAILIFCSIGIYYEHLHRPFRVPVAAIVATAGVMNILPGWFILAYCC